MPKDKVLFFQFQQNLQERAEDIDKIWLMKYIFGILLLEEGLFEREVIIIGVNIEGLMNDAHSLIYNIVISTLFNEGGVYLRDVFMLDAFELID